MSIKDSIFKMCALIAVSVGLHVFYTLKINEVTLEDMVGPRFAGQVREVDAALASQHPEKKVFYFCDSVNWHVAPEDKDKSPISGFLDDQLVTADVLAVDRKAYHMGVYSSYVYYILEKKKARVGLMIVPINLRSLTTHFYLNWSWQFNDLQRYLRYDSTAYRLSFRPFRTFRAYEDSGISYEDYTGFTVFDGVSPAGKVRDYTGDGFLSESDENLRKKIVFYYMQPLTPDHERVCEMAEIASLASKHAQTVIFYVTPVDYITCDSYLDGRYSKQIRANVDVLRNVLADNGNKLLDLSFELGPDYFSYGGVPAYPNEHLNEAGRRCVAKRLMETIKDRGILDTPGMEKNDD